MRESKYKNIYHLLSLEKADEARRAFLVYDEEDSAEYHLIKGKIEQKFQNWGNAINAFSRVLEIDPENKEAQHNLHIIQNILNFWNPEMFNP